MLSGSLSFPFYVATAIVVIMAVFIAKKMNAKRLEIDAGTAEGKMVDKAIRRVIVMLLLGALLLAAFLLLVAKPAVLPA